MNDAIIKVTDVIEHEDGTATVKLDLEPEVFGKIFSIGFIHLLMKGIESEKEDEL
tara:strand:+ start:2311 stop:2475 length:165 start_codon:yes stop_codon:yes gene_type:complete